MELQRLNVVPQRGPVANPRRDSADNGDKRYGEVLPVNALMTGRGHNTLGAMFDRAASQREDGVLHGPPAHPVRQETHR